MLGTKRPSITSTWIQSAPAAPTARTSSPSRPKSADRIDGATMTGRLIRRPSWSRDRPPLPTAAPEQIVRSLRPGAARRIYLERNCLVVLPQIQDRLHDLPPGLDAVRPVEQHRIPDHAVVNQCFIAGGRLGVEIILVGEIHPHPPKGNLRARNLRAELQRCTLVGLDLPGENIGRRDVDRSVADNSKRHQVGSDCDFRCPTRY